MSPPVLGEYLTVRLVVWRVQNLPNSDFSVDERLRRKVNTALRELSEDPGNFQWVYLNGQRLPVAEGFGMRILIELQHRQIREGDPRQDTVIETLCELILDPSSRSALNDLFVEDELRLSPMSEGSLTPTDVLFGKCFTLRHLARFNTDNSMSVAMEVSKSKGFFNRNSGKWYYAPLCAVRIVPAFFTFFADTINAFPPELIESTAEAFGRGDAVPQLQTALATAQQMTLWSPRTLQRIDQELSRIGGEGKKLNLKARARTLFDTERRADACVNALGNRDPTSSEMVRLVDEFGTMMRNVAPLFEATLDYVDWILSTSVGYTVKTGLGALGSVAAVSAGAAATGGVAVGFALVACFIGGAVTTDSAINAVESWTKWSKSKEIKVIIEEVSMILQTCRLFLWMMIVNTKAYMELDQQGYRKFKKLMMDNLQCDLDRVSQNGYINELIRQYHNNLHEKVKKIATSISAL